MLEEESVPSEVHHIKFVEIQYSKNPHRRTHVFKLQAVFVLIYRVFSAKTA